MLGASQVLPSLTTMQSSPTNGAPSAMPPLTGDLVAMLTRVLDGVNHAGHEDLDEMEHSLILARCRVRTLKNARQPVNCLAPEVLSEVFFHLDSLRHLENMENVLSNSIEKTKAILATIQVCRQWRYVALFTPNLWSHIHIRRPSDRLAMRALELSGNQPLVIYHFDKNKDATKSLENGPDAFEMAMGHSHRIEELYINGHWAADCAYWKVFDREAPRLKTLRIAGPDVHNASAPLPKLFKGFYPSLKQIFLSTYSPISDNQFHNLQSLMLHGQANQTHEHQGFTEFLPLLSLSPRLEECTIAFSGSITVVPGNAFISEYLNHPVHLLNLRTLVLGCWTSGVTATTDLTTFLSCIRIPDDTSRYIFADGQAEWTFPLIDILQNGRAQPSTSRHIRKMQMIASRVIGGSHAVAIEGDTLTLTSNIHPTERNLLFSTGALSDVEELALVLSPSYPPALEEYRAILLAVPSLRRLIISGEIRGSTVFPRITKALGLDASPTGDHEIPLCPLLESLDLCHYPRETDSSKQVDALLFVMFAEQRFRTGHSLERIGIEGCREEHLKQLETWVGEASCRGLHEQSGPLGYWVECKIQEMQVRARKPAAIPRIR